MSNNNSGRPPLAYEKEAFLDSSEGRSVRILSEYLDPLREFRLNKIHDTVVFFGSARTPDPETEAGRSHPASRYYGEARELAHCLTKWSLSLEAEPGKHRPNPDGSPRRFVVCSGGGPGIMEAANRGAAEAGGLSIGLNIGLPMEQFPNPYISPNLNFEFHYFFMRKFWFAYLAKALVVFPGGFGTMDEMTEILTLVQTRKLHKQMVIVLYGASFWKKLLNFEALVEAGMISPEDMDLFHFADTVEEAFALLRDGLSSLYLNPETPLTDEELKTPAIAKSTV